MRSARRPTAKQVESIRRAGLTPGEWLVRFEDDRYLHLVDRGLEQREIVIIDKTTTTIVKSPAV